MHDVICNLLSAYLDKELQGSLLLNVERHLEECAFCREKLQEMRFISNFVRSVPLPEFTSSERFTARLNLILPRQRFRDRSIGFMALRWAWIPTALLLVWVMIQMGFFIINTLTITQITGLAAGIPWPRNEQSAFWLNLLGRLLNGHLGGWQNVLFVLHGLVAALQNVWDSLLWQLGIVLLYWSSLMFLWRRHTSSVLEGMLSVRV